MLHALSQSDSENCEILLLCVDRFRLFQVTESLVGKEVYVFSRCNCSLYHVTDSVALTIINVLPTTQNRLHFRVTIYLSLWYGLPYV